MSIFKKSEPPPPKPRERPAPMPRPAQGDGAISIIGSGMTVIGDIQTEGIVRIEGEVQGTVRAGKAVVIGQTGVVDGSIVTEDAVIGGTISGTIIASVRVELQTTCFVSGEIRTRAEHLKLEEGARFAGKVQMLEEGADMATSPGGEPKASPETDRGPVTEMAWSGEESPGQLDSSGSVASGDRPAEESKVRIP
jgi:cytoskeletal protein CcmA (bactofilin family)